MSRLPNKTDDELTALAMDILGNRVYTDRHLPPGNPDMVGSIFMCVILGSFADWTDEEMKDLGMIYEYLDKAGPMSCNGRPMFMSHRLLNKADAEIVWAKVKRAREAMENAALSVHRTGAGNG